MFDDLPDRVKSKHAFAVVPMVFPCRKDPRKHGTLHATQCTDRPRTYQSAADLPTIPKYPSAACHPPHESARMTPHSTTKLSGKVALVTGASAGIGRARRLMLAQNGADVAINYLTAPEGGEELAERSPRPGPACPALCRWTFPISRPSKRWSNSVVAELGRLDILVSNAVFSERELFYKADMAGFRRTIDVTCGAPSIALRASANADDAPGQGGGMVVVSSGHAKVAIPSSHGLQHGQGRPGSDGPHGGHGAGASIASASTFVYPGWTDTPGERKYLHRRKC